MKFRLENGCFGYRQDDAVLDHVSFEANPGDVVSILGPNGAGKTTLLKCMLGFQKFSEGMVSCDDIPADQMKRSDFWKKIAYVPQARVQAFPYTVRETVLMGRSSFLSMFETPHAKDIEIAEEAMKTAGIDHLADRVCNEISGGEMQLALIARALASNPEVLVMDEPETGLDFRNQLIVLQLIRKLSREKNITVIFNTHYPTHALEVSSHTLLLEKNGSALFGKTSEVLSVENMQKVFGIDIRMEAHEINDQTYYSIIPLGLRKEREQ